MQRRAFLATGTACLAAALTPRIGLRAASSNKKHCTLLHVTDTHGQLENHLEYLRGAIGATPPVARSPRKGTNS